MAPLIFSHHALRRMRERRVTTAEVHQAVASGAVIEEYPDDRPYPSRLVCWNRGDSFVHVVVAERTEDGASVVVTVYRPHPDEWEAGFTKRRLR